MTDFVGEAVPVGATEHPQFRYRIPPGATDVLLVRHGESAAMGTTDFPTTPSGQADPELSPTGLRQAELLGERLSQIHIDALYVTSLRRTQLTAAPLVARTGLTPVVEPELREIELGEWEGGEFRRRVVIQDPRMMRLLAGEDWNVVPGAEDHEKFALRIKQSLERIHAAHPDQRVVVIVHGGVIGQALAHATGAKPLAMMVCDNTSISQIILNGSHWNVRRYNDTAHLGPAFPATAQTLQ